MNFKSQKGISGVDITVSIVLITIFVTLACMVSGRIIQNRNRSSVGREAISYAISEIESLKQKTVDDSTLVNSSGYITNTSFYKIITIEDCRDILGGSTIAGKLKKATVEIKYKESGTVKTIELSTMIY